MSYIRSIKVICQSVVAWLSENNIGHCPTTLVTLKQIFGKEDQRFIYLQLTTWKATDCFLPQRLQAVQIAAKITAQHSTYTDI